MAPPTVSTLQQGITTTKRFGIGTWQPVTGGTLYQTGFPSTNQSLAVVHPYAGTYGGQYGFVVDSSIRPPQRTSPTPAPEVGLDNTGISIVRGFQTITWSYSTIRPDYWYYFMNLWKQSARTPPGYQYLVLLMYPDLTGSTRATPLFVLARWNPPTHSARDVSSYQGVTLTFTHVGLAQLAQNTLIQV